MLLGPGAPSASRLVSPLALGFVLGYVAPAKTGEPATALLVSRAFQIPLTRTLSALAAERGLQLVVLLATFVCAALAKAGDLLELRGAIVAAAILLAVLLAGLAAARPLLTRLAPLARRIPRFGAPVAESLEALRDILADGRRRVSLTFLAGLFWALQYISLWAILSGGGAGIDLTAAAVVAGAAILGGTLTLVPLGTQDGISAVVLRAFGVPLATGFSLALLHTALSLACGAALLLFLPLWGARREVA